LTASLAEAMGWGNSRQACSLRDQERHARAMDASDDGFWDWIPADDTTSGIPVVGNDGFSGGTG